MITELALGKGARSMLLPATSQSPPAGRRFARDLLDEWGFPASYQVVVIVNELVTSAVVHTTGTIMLSLDLDDGTIRIVVSDNGGQARRHERRDPTSEVLGGLALVSATAIDWGVRQRECGKTVWADVDVHPLRHRVA